MTKKPEPLLDHLGWRLWLASRQWQTSFVAAMRDAGHHWFTDARANLLAHIAREGTPQSLLISRVGVSKQAVQQLVDGLEAEGILERVADPADNRSKIIRYTDAGANAIRQADRLKQRIEDEYRKKLGEVRFNTLAAALRDLTEDAKSVDDS